MQDLSPGERRLVSDLRAGRILEKASKDMYFVVDPQTPAMIGMQIVRLVRRKTVATACAKGAIGVRPSIRFGCNIYVPLISPNSLIGGSP